MSVIIAGTLKDGMGNPLANTGLELRANGTSGFVVTGAVAYYLTGPDGAYTFNVNNGHYGLFINFGGRGYGYVGDVDVIVGSVSGTIEDFLTIPGEEEITPEILQQVLQARADAAESAARAEDAKNRAYADSRAEIDQAIRDAGYDPFDSFEDGFTLTNVNQALRLKSNGSFYSWRGEFPKVVPKNSTPDTTGGFSRENAWVDVNDLLIRKDLQSSDGLKYVGRCKDIHELRNTRPSVANQHILLAEYVAGAGPSTGGGLYWLNDTGLQDDSVTFFRVDSTGGWTRDISGGINSMWAGDILTGDATDKLNLISSASALRKKLRINLPSGLITVSGTWWINSGDDMMIVGQGMGNTKIFGDNSTQGPVILVKKSNYDANKERTRNFKLRDVQLSGQAVDDSGVSWAQRDLLHMYGVGFDFDISDVWFNNFGRRAVYAVDLWDGDFRNCKIHAGGGDLTWTETVFAHAFCFVRDSDSCNAVRITNCHFEGLRRGAIKSQDFNHSFFLLNNKFESCNSSNLFTAVNIIDIADSFRNFVMVGGIITLNQWAKHKHAVRCSNDSTFISGVRFTSPSRSDGAACLDVIPGAFLSGATISAHFDVRGDIIDGASNVVYPIQLGGIANLSNSTVKLFNPGATFRLNGNSNDISKVNVLTLGFNGPQTFVYQSFPTNKFRGITVTGSVNVDGLNSFTNISSTFDAGQYGLMKNLSAAAIQPGAVINGGSLLSCDLSGNTVGASPVGLWRAVSLVPTSGAGLFERIR